MKNANASKTAIYAALLGNLLVAVTKFIAAALSGSSSMLSEGVHSLVDTVNELLLLYGMRRSIRTPDPAHPLGYGRELYFWEGVAHVRAPSPVADVAIVYIVLALSFLFEGASWRVSQRAFRAAKGDLGYWEAVRMSKDPPSFIVLFEDSAALIGIVIAAAGTYAADSLQMPVFDGVASILIGAVLAATSVALARESKGLLIGERADPQIAVSIEALARAEPGVAAANGVITVQLAPDQIVVALSLEFEDELRTPQIEEAVARLEQRMRTHHPQIVALFVKPQTPGGYERIRRSRYGGDTVHAVPARRSTEPP